MKNTVKKTINYIRADVYRTILQVSGLIVAITALYQGYMYIQPYTRLNYPVFVPANTSLDRAGFFIYTNRLRLEKTSIDLLLFPKTDVSYYFKKNDVTFVTVIKKDIERFDYKCQDLSHKSSYIESWFCDVKTTPNGQRYMHSGWVEHQGSSAQPTEWIELEKEGSYIGIENQSFDMKYYKKADWSSIVDSLQELHPTPQTLPVIRADVNPL